MKNENHSLRTFFVVIGAFVSIAAVLSVLYTVFKKYFKITFECDDCDDCDGCSEDCFDEDCDKAYEPICSCQSEDENNAEPAAN